MLAVATTALHVVCALEIGVRERRRGKEEVVPAVGIALLTGPFALAEALLSEEE